MVIDRWASNTMRRYHVGAGNILVVTHPIGQARRCVVIPAAAKASAGIPTPARDIRAQLLAQRSSERHG